MLSLKQIKLAINNMLITKFPSIDIQSTDIKEGFNRAAFFVTIDNVNRDTRLYHSERSMTIRIHYFPSDRYKNSLELLDIQDDLESIFNLNFIVEDRVITIDDTQSQVVDGVLEFEFDFNFLESNDITETGELMGELEIGDI